MTFQGPTTADGDVGIASTTVKTETAPADSVTFAGRFANSTLGFTPGVSQGKVILTFNLYIIGTWAGDRKKGPSQIWQLNYACAGGAPISIINATFSNRLGNAQSYPSNINGTHVGGMYSATGLNTLNYKSRPDLQDTFSQYTTDVGDSRYAIQRTIPACPSGQTRTIMFTGLNLANVFNAAWGVDNISAQPTV